MNHPHNKDECRIQRSGRQKIQHLQAHSPKSLPKAAWKWKQCISLLILKRNILSWLTQICHACVWHLKIICCIKNPRDVSPFRRVWRPPTLTVHKNLATQLDPLMFSPPSPPRSPSFLMPLIIHAVYTVCPFLVAQTPPELVNCVGDTGLCVKQQ